jgi:antitoxin ParD1/3/4
MNVSLTPELEEMVGNKVKSGMYHTASEVIREGLRLLKQQGELRQFRMSQFRDQVNIGLNQLEHGQYSDYDADSISSQVEEIKAEGIDS